MKVVYLRPKSVFKTELRSDTLWGLIIVALRKLISESEINNLLQRFVIGKPPFLISSAMPFNYENNNIVHYFFRPILKTSDFKVSNAKDMTIYKKFKKIKYLKQDVFEKLLNSEITEFELWQDFISQKFLQANNLISTSITLHNTIDRMTDTTLEIDNEGQLFYTEDFYIKNGGLFFLIKGETDIIECALRYLNHLGYGGDAYIGKGFFDYQLSDLELRIPQSFHSFVTLSLYNPTNDELLDFKLNKQYYALTSRTGKIGTHFTGTTDYKKNLVNMFIEGSTFLNKDKTYYGKMQIVKVLNSYKIYNYGYAFNIPAKWKE